ncbi:hypothetical protein MXD81_17670, partial [Microbacteriaceae bacterium K1510]|nr:hypothetical protein [Microbacteriaceae bacterium K1510]
MNKRLGLTVCSVLLLLGSALAGCASKPTDSGAQQTPQQSQQAAQPTNTVGKKGELTIGVVGDPHSWDPVDTFLLDWSTIATSVFEGLVER